MKYVQRWSRGGAQDGEGRCSGGLGEVHRMMRGDVAVV